MMSTLTLGIIVMVAYFAVLFAVTIISSKKTKDLDGYYLGGRTLGPWTLALTYCATAFSTSLLVGNAGAAYVNGFAQMWIAPAQALAILVGFMVFQRRFQTMSIRLKVLDVPDFIGERYQSQFMRGLSSALICVLFVGYIVAIYVGLATLMEVILGIPYWVAVLIAGITTAVYVTFGGYLAVAYSDALQGWLLVIGTLLVTVFAISRVGGIGTVASKLATIDPQMLKTPGSQGWLMWLTPVLVFSLGHYGQPQQIQRFFTLKNKKQVTTAALVGTLFTLVMVSMPNLLGPFARVLFPTLERADMAFPMLVQELLPAGFAVVILVAALAAGMSTNDSVLLVASSAFARNIMQKIIKPDLSDEAVLKIGRITAFALGIIGMVFALKPPQLLLMLTVFVWAVFSAAFMAPLLYGIFWRKATKAGAIVSMVSGASIAFIWEVIGKPLGIHPLFVSVLFAFIALPVVSHFTPKLPEQLVNKLFAK